MIRGPRIFQTLECQVTFVSPNKSKGLDKKVWNSLWNSPLHERHKTLVWQILNNMIPTKDRLKHLIPLHDTSCFLCKSSLESIDHMIFECLITAKWWIQSPWQICISYFTCIGYVKKFSLLLDEGDLFQIDGEERPKILQFVVLVFEQMWLSRNKIRIGDDMQDWEKLLLFC